MLTGNQQLKCYRNKVTELEFNVTSKKFFKKYKKNKTQVEKIVIWSSKNQRKLKKKIIQVFKNKTYSN